MGSHGEEFDVEGSPARPRPARAEPRPVISFLVWTFAGLLLITAGILIAPATDRHSGLGIHENLSDQPQALWSIPFGTSWPEQADVWVTGDVVIVSTGQLVVGVERDSGELLWEVRGSSQQCALNGARVACVNRGGQDAELVEINRSDGESRRTTQPYLQAAIPYAGGMITVFEGREELMVTRSDDEGHWWSHSMPRPERDDLAGLALDVISDTVLVHLQGESQSSSAVLDATNGQERSGHSVIEESDGQWLVTTAGDLLLYAPGFSPVPVRDAAVEARVDDEFGTGAALDFRSGTARTISLDSGQMLWETELQGAQSILARVSDVVVTSDSSTLSGLNGQTGNLMWQTELEGHGCPCLGAEGMLALTQNSSSGSALVGIRLADGEEAWRFPMSYGGFAWAADYTDLAVVTNLTITLYSLAGPGTSSRQTAAGQPAQWTDG